MPASRCRLPSLDTAVAVNVTQAISYFCSGDVPQRLGNAHPHIVPYEVFPTSDGHIILAVANDAQFARFCAAAGRDELAADPRFRANADRVRNREVLVPLVREIIGGRTKAQWMAQLEACDVACGPINNFQEVFDDPQVRHRGLRVDMPHPLGGVAPVIANPMRLSATPVQYHSAPPLLGQHNADVYGSLLGMPEADIEQLRAAGVI